MNPEPPPETDMSVPTIDEVSDRRIDEMQDALTLLLQAHLDGFANNTLFRSELASLLIEVKHARKSARHG
jgi:hypothetical protein